MLTLRWLNDEEARKTSNLIPYCLLEADPFLSASPFGTGVGNYERKHAHSRQQHRSLESLIAFLYRQVKCIYIDPSHNTQTEKGEEGKTCQTQVHRTQVFQSL